MILRPYQQQIKTDIQTAWKNGSRNVCAVLPTGAGKTVVFADIIKEHGGSVCAIAHRQELVTQISTSLAADGVRHGIIGPMNVVKLAVSLHMEKFGRSYYDPNAQIKVAGVDTMVRRGASLDHWAQSVTLWVQDECHHLLKDNKWGKAIGYLPNARGLGVTATPLRAAGKGLGAHVDGVLDKLIVGPNMRDLINAGFLSDYRIFAPSSDLDVSGVKVSQVTGDYNPVGLKLAVKKSHIIGDVVSHYLRIAPGKLGVTFATDVETARDIADQFNAAGVPAVMLCAKSKDRERIKALRDFKNRKILQIVNVDLFGEGFDCPAIEVVSMARPTQSYGLYVQVFGRGLRIMEGKDKAIIIDHVGNILRHGLPDKPKVWSLERRERKSQQNAPAEVKICPKCTGVYSKLLSYCPYCGEVPVPARRDGPEFVDGDLFELDAATLAEMRGEVAKIDRTTEDYESWMNSKGTPRLGVLRNLKLHVEKQETQALLRDLISWWAGIRRAEGRDDSYSYKKFYLDFGIDVLSAQGLGTKDAKKLTENIINKMEVEK